jgi:hypothetical protein
LVGHSWGFEIFFSYKSKLKPEIKKWNTFALSIKNTKPKIDLSTCEATQPTVSALSHIKAHGQELEKKKENRENLVIMLTSSIE